jgi:hypothetical protein
VGKKRRKRRNQSAKPRRRSVTPPARPTPPEAILAKHEDHKSRLGQRNDRLAALLARATRTEKVGSKGLIQGVLTEDEHEELQRQLENARERYPDELRGRIAELRQLLDRLHPLAVLARFTATNIIEFWGQYYEPTSTGSEAKIEFVAGILAAASPDPGAPDPPDSGEIQRVMDVVDEIFDTSSLLNLAREATQTEQGDAEVRYTARAQWLHIRGPSYPQHAEELAHAVFDRYSQKLRTTLGFDLNDLIEVERAATTLMEERYNAVLEVAMTRAPEISAATKRAAEEADDADELPADEDLQKWAVVQVWDDALTSALTFDIDELTEYIPEADREVVQAVLTRFALEVGSLTPGQYSSPIDHSPLSDRPFVQWNDRYLLPVPGIIARDYVSLLEKDLLASEKGFSRWRATVVDDLSVGYVASTLPGCQAFERLFYRVVEDGEEKWPDVDGLVVFDEVAIIVEGKATPLSSPALRGDVQRARADLRRAIETATGQAERAGDYLRQNDPAIFYDEDQNEVARIGTGQIERLHLVLPTLHPLADYGMNPGKLSALGITASTDAWTVDVNDLRIISETVQNPAEFLHYLEWRSRIPLGESVHAVDEVDLFASYLLREQFEQLRDNPSAHIQLTGSTTDFDDYYLGEYGHGPRKPRPRMFSIPLVSRFVKRVSKERPPGWLSAAGTCLDLSLEELAAADVLIRRLSRHVKTGEVLWQHFGTCLFIVLGAGVKWATAWEQLPDRKEGAARVLFADVKKGKPRLVWALEPDVATLGPFPTRG